MILAYFKQHVLSISLFAVFGLICAGIFYLYHLPVEAVFYAFLLCACVGFAVGGIDFYHYRKRLLSLKSLENRIVLSIEELPVAGQALEQEYERLIELVHQDKIQLISQADAARSDMMDYYTMWAHQIKTPIAAMRLLLQTEDTEENAELLAELFKIEQYVEMVLSYLRLDSDSNDLVLKFYPLDPIIRQAIRKYAKSFIRKKIRLEYEGTKMSVLTDEKWLSFVIEQLLSNALKYTNAGKIRITADEVQKQLLITDTGIGIEAEDLPRVFEKGYTGYNGRMDKKSTGIGLYLCQRIIKTLSHTISISSEVGRGTCVTLGLKSLDIRHE